MKTIFRQLFCFLFLVSFFFIIPSAQAAGLIPCSGTDCKPCHILVLIVNLVNFMLKSIVAPLAGLMFLVGGIMIVSDGGSGNRMKKGKEIIKNTLIGAVIALSAWVIVNTLIMAFGSNQISSNWWSVQCK